MSEEYIKEIEGHMQAARKVLEKNKTDPFAQNVIFYGDYAILAAKTNDKLRMKNLRAQVIGYSN